MEEYITQLDPISLVLYRWHCYLILFGLCPCDECRASKNGKSSSIVILDFDENKLLCNQNLLRASVDWFFGRN